MTESQKLELMFVIQNFINEQNKQQKELAEMWKKHTENVERGLQQLDLILKMGN